MFGLSNVLTGAKSVVTGLWSGVASKISTILIYVSIGVTLAVGVSAVWFYKQNTALHTQVGSLGQDAVTLAGKVKALEVTNSKQDDAIADLVHQREKDGDAVQGLINDYKALSNDNLSTKAKLRDLERKSDEVKAYLSTPLPASVRSVLNGKDPAADHSGPSEADGSVPANR